MLEIILVLHLIKLLRIFIVQTVQKSFQVTNNFVHIVEMNIFRVQVVNLTMIRKRKNVSHVGSNWLALAYHLLLFV